MSSDDFDNSAPDNRPTERWTRIADAARYDERRKIWHAFGMTGAPPTDDAAMIAAIRTGPAPAPGTFADRLPIPTVEQRIAQAREAARNEALLDVVRVAGAALDGPPEPATVVTAILDHVRAELDEVRRALGACDGESAFEALGRSRDADAKTLVHAVRTELAEIYGILAQAAAPWSDLARVRQECRDAARSASTARSMLRGFEASARQHLIEIYIALTGEQPCEDWNADALVEHSVRIIHSLANVEPEQHEEVEVATTSGLVLRSVELARGIAALNGAGPVEHTRYLRLADTYFIQAPAPTYSLPEEYEHRLAIEAAAALNVNDGVGYLEALRRVVSESHAQEPAGWPAVCVELGAVIVPGETVVLADPREARLAAVRELRPVLAELRAAAGLWALDVEPVHVHELHQALSSVAQDIRRAREAALWLAARDALSICDVHERLFVRQAEHGGRGLDLKTLTSCWYTYWRQRVSDELNEKIAAIALRLQG